MSEANIYRITIGKTVVYVIASAQDLAIEQVRRQVLIARGPGMEASPLTEEIDKIEVVNARGDEVIRDHVFTPFDDTVFYIDAENWRDRK